MLAVRSTGLHVVAFLLEAVGAAGDVGADVFGLVRPPAPAEKLRRSVDSEMTFKIVRLFAVVSDEGLGEHDSRFSPPVHDQQFRSVVDGQ